MQKVRQTIFASKDHDPGQTPSVKSGNCLQAAVASLLDLSLEDVPHFLEDGDNWAESMTRFCRARGYEVFLQTEPTQFGLAYGMSPRFVTHAVVYIAGKMAWDPHPSGAGLIGVTAYLDFRKVNNAHGN